MNVITWTPAAIDDFKYTSIYDKPVHAKLLQIVEYLKLNNPPYKPFHAEKFGKYMIDFPNCWSMHLSQNIELFFTIKKTKY
ncbi:MAG: hypothetical protein LBF36_01890 [Mycoplasmataceae bacterium]|jgi:Txe/YoeB family toxin of Txe-Axe toxin-antitoxin module|nr:hypothetical protein [Mycoplasmataceae bacterium]